MDEQVVEIVKLKLAPKYYYKAVPVLNRHVYRLADLVNKSSHEFLPGEATMYQGTDFVGRMPMPLVAIGEEFTAGFGVDTQLQIQRQMVDQNRTTQGGNQVLKYDYRILISSYKSQPVKLQLWDRLPKGEGESDRHPPGQVHARAEQGRHLSARKPAQQPAPLGRRGARQLQRRKRLRRHLRLPHGTRPPDGDHRLPEPLDDFRLARFAQNMPAVSATIRRRGHCR